MATRTNPAKAAWQAPIVWAAVFSTLGFVFGRAISVVIGEIVHYETELVMVILAAGVVWFAAYRVRAARRSGAA